MAAVLIGSDNIQPEVDAGESLGGGRARKCGYRRKLLSAR